MCRAGEVVRPSVRTRAIRNRAGGDGSSSHIGGGIASTINGRPSVGDRSAGGSVDRQEIAVAIVVVIKPPCSAIGKDHASHEPHKRVAVLIVGVTRRRREIRLHVVGRVAKLECSAIRWRPDRRTAWCHRATGGAPTDIGAVGGRRPVSPQSIRYDVSRRGEFVAVRIFDKTGRKELNAVFVNEKRRRIESVGESNAVFLWLYGKS
jgi:hypothetical protein